MAFFVVRLAWPIKRARSTNCAQGTVWTTRLRRVPAGSKHAKACLESIVPGSPPSGGLKKLRVMSHRASGPAHQDAISYDFQPPSSINSCNDLPLELARVLASWHLVSAGHYLNHRTAVFNEWGRAVS